MRRWSVTPLCVSWVSSSPAPAAALGRANLCDPSYDAHCRRGRGPLRWQLQGHVRPVQEVRRDARAGHTHLRWVDPSVTLLQYQYLPPSHLSAAVETLLVAVPCSSAAMKAVWVLRRAAQHHSAPEDSPSGWFLSCSRPPQALSHQPCQVVHMCAPICTPCSTLSASRKASHISSPRLQQPLAVTG